MLSSVMLRLVGLVMRIAWDVVDREVVVVQVQELSQVGLHFTQKTHGTMYTALVS
jgi:hypothetical protein